MNFSPVILFAFNRPDHTQKTLEALSNNTLANQTHLYIFCDGPKKNASPEQLEKIKQTRKIANLKKWCKEVTVFESETNKGLAQNIISGVTEIVNKHGKVIVLEDDIVTGKYFLEFMNEALEKYKDNKEVFHITGWRDPINNTKKDSSFFYPTMDCWSWATWDDRWKYFKKDAKYYKSIFTKKMIKEFNIEGTDPDNWGQIEANLNGSINTWAIFWYASIFLQKGLCLAPTSSLCRNIGFDNSGEHCGPNDSQTIIDSIDIKITEFPENIEIDRTEFNKNKHFITTVRYKKTPLYYIKRLIPKPVKTLIKLILHKK